MMKIKILEAVEKQDFEEARILFMEYFSSLGIDLSFQNVEFELAHFNSIYSKPYGKLLLSQVDGETVGCVAFRKIDGITCEMKRLYVKPNCRNAGIGRALCETLIREAKETDFQFMRLDTLPSMVEAKELYKLLGFKEIEAYYQNPIEGAIFMEMAIL